MLADTKFGALPSDVNLQSEPAAYRFAGKLPAALDSLRDRRQWLAWKHHRDDKRQRWTKPPCDARTGKICGATDPRHCGTFVEAYATFCRQGLAGVGLALFPGDDLTGIDLDHCRDPETGELSPLAQRVLKFSETYAEVSPSGTGLHLLARGKHHRTIKCDAAGIEAYTQGRYLTVTGAPIGAPLGISPAPRTLALLDEVVDQAYVRRKASLGRETDAATIFRRVSQEALKQFDDWVPALLPKARKQATGGWRVTSHDLGRNLQEDLSIHPDGIRDFGTEEPLTAIELVMRYQNRNPAEAALWLCERMRIDPASLGWKHSRRGVGDNSGSTEPLEDPVPLFGTLSPGSAFPVDALGPVMAPAALALHQAVVQAPLAMCASGLLAAASLSTQALADVLLPWSEKVPLSLYFLILAESGERKSALHGRVLAGARMRSEELEMQFVDDTLRHQIEVTAFEMARKAIAAEKHLTPAQRRQQLEELGPEPTRPRNPFIMVKEPTREGLEKVMLNGQPTVGLFSPEAGEFLGGHSMGKEYRTSTSAKLNTLWDGDGIERIRAGEEPAINRAARLSLFLQVQPAAAKVLSDPILRDIGFLSRVLISQPESMMGSRFAKQATPEELRALVEFTTRSFGLLQQAEPGIKRVVIEFSAQAARALMDFMDHVEGEMAKGGRFEAIRGFAAKLGQHVARIAAVMKFFEIEKSDPLRITLPLLARAIDIAEFYASEALRLHDVTEINAQLREAQLLSEWLRDKWGSGAFSVTEIVRYGPGSIRDAVKVRELLSVLEANGHVKQIGKAVIAWPTGETFNRKEAWRVCDSCGSCDS